MPSASRERKGPPPIKADRRLADGVPAVIELETGVRIAVPNDYWSISTWVLAEQEDWFEPELAFLRRVVEPGWRILDIGANHGVYAASLAHLVGPSGQVVAVEPQAAVVERLELTRRENRLEQLTILRSAVADEPGTLDLFSGHDSELASLVDDGHGIAERVPVTTLPAIAEATGIDRPDLIKIDVEGVEERVLAGAATWLAEREPLVMFEIGKDDARNQRLVTQLNALGYRCHLLLPGLEVLTPLGSVPVTSFTINLFACPPARARSLAARGLLLESAPTPPSGPGDWYTMRDRLTEALDPARPKADRLAAALAALGDLGSLPTRIRARSGAPERLLAIARACWLLGLRAGTLAALSPLLERFDERPWGLSLVPFWPQPRFDGTRPGDAAPTAGIAALDAAIWSMAFSGYFVTRPPAGLLETVRDDPWFDAHLERRRQLWRTRAGLQDGLIACGPLAAAPRNRHLLA